MRDELAGVLKTLRGLLPDEYQATGRRQYRMEPLSGLEIEALDALLRKAGRL
jgi:hypothetical protein